MEFKERIVLILAWLRYIGENYPSPYGTKVSYIREAMKTRNKADILDADIKYLFDKDYIENWYTPPDAKKWPYMYGMDYLIKITDLPPKKWTQRRENGKLTILLKEVSDGTKENEAVRQGV